MQQPPQGPWGQPPPQQYPPQGPMMQQPYPQHPGTPPPMQAMAAPGKAANPALLVVGALLLFVGLGAGAVFLYNV